MKNRDNSTVSIIVPVYNAEEYLDCCINSLINQSYNNIEIILIDDGSSDNSYFICMKYAKQDNRIKVLKQENGGPASARNNGIINSTGEYILFVDSDDFIDSDMIYKMMMNNKNNEYDIILCSYRKIFTNYYEEIDVKSMNSFEEYLFESPILGYSMCKLVKKEKICSLFEDNLYYLEDMIFWVKNSKQIKKVLLVNECLYNYRMIQTSLLNHKIFNDKKKSIFTSCNTLIELVHNKYKYIYEKMYVDNYYLYHKYLNSDYYNDYLKCYKSLINNKKISIIIRIKVFIKHILLKLL